MGNVGNRNGMGNMHNMNAMGMEPMGMQHQHHINDKPAMSPYANHGSGPTPKLNPRFSMLNTERAPCPPRTPGPSSCHMQRLPSFPHRNWPPRPAELMSMDTRTRMGATRRAGDADAAAAARSFSLYAMRGTQAKSDGGAHVADARPCLKIEATWRREERRQTRRRVQVGGKVEQWTRFHKVKE